MTSTQVFVGIDVSKKQLDLAFRPEGRFAAPNDETGLPGAPTPEHRLPRPGSVGSHGGIEIPLAGALAAAGVPVVVVNPRQVRTLRRRQETGQDRWAGRPHAGALR